MIDFSTITTLLFDIDNTLLLLDEQEFLQVYGKLIHGFFKEEQPDIQKFMRILLESTAKMYEKDLPKLNTFSKFAQDFSSKIGLSQEEIIKRFLLFYKTDFHQVSCVVSPVPIAKTLLSLASKYFTVVAATTPLFPTIANKKRLEWVGLGTNNIPWKEITSAENYHFTKPHLEYYQELLCRINRKSSECLIIGNDIVNDMVAGQLGIRTYLVTNSKKSNKIIQTSLDHEKPDFAVDYSGSLEDFHDSLKQFIRNR
ncbi:MAG: HAD family hydrolase [Candidatus Hodarchaeales archaeon]